MSNIAVNESLVSFCGLYCGACRAYIQGKCLGCRENTKATWCKVRSCCLDSHLSDCSQCLTFKDLNECKKLNNFISKIFGLIFNSDRKKGIQRINEIGRGPFAKEMADSKRAAIPRKK